MDMWLALHKLVADQEEGIEPPHILIDENTPEYVVLLWDDGSCGSYKYNHSDKCWHACESLSTCPCDVAARDTF